MIKMQFTVIFRCKEDAQISYEINFEPNSIWKRGESWELSLNTEHAGYQLGSVKRLLDREVYLEDILYDSKEVIVICEEVNTNHPYLLDLVKDLKEEGFRIKVYSFPVADK